MTKQPDILEIVLVENNAYDRAVLDVCLMSDSRIRLVYTADDGSVPLSPYALWLRLLGDTPKPDLVLFDLALTPWCGTVMAQSHYRRFLKNASPGLRAMDRALRTFKRPIRRLLAELSIGLRAAADFPAFANDLLSRLSLTCQLPPGDVPPELRPALEAARRSVAKGGDFARTFEGIVHGLWGGEQAAWDLAKAPSALRFFVCATSFPEICFGVVSHFADEDSRLALRTILGARSTVPWPAERVSLLNALIVNKAELFYTLPSHTAPTSPSPLAARLRDALQAWQALGSPGSMTAPFCRLPVLYAAVDPTAQSASTTSDQPVTRTCSFEEWCRETLPALIGEGGDGPADPPLCTVLLDQTLLLVGGNPANHAWKCSGHDGWSTFVQNPRAELRKQTLGDVRFGPDYPVARLYLIEQPVHLADTSAFLESLHSGGAPTVSCCVVLASEDAAVRRLLDTAHERGHLRLYRLPPRLEWTKRRLLARRRPFDGVVIAENLVDQLRIPISGGQRIHRFAELPAAREHRKSLIKKIASFLLDESIVLHLAFERLVARSPAVEADLATGLPLNDVLLKYDLGLRRANLGGSASTTLTD